MHSQRGQSERAPGAGIRVLNGGALNDRSTGREGSGTAVKDRLDFPRPYGADPYVAKLARDVAAIREPVWVRIAFWLGISSFSVFTLVGVVTAARWAGPIVWGWLR